MTNESARGHGCADPSRHVAVVVCTRDRGDMITATIDSILENAIEDVEVIVVDQSHEDDTRQALIPYIDSGSVRYIRSEQSGLCRARNLALASTDAELVLSTDDDCVVGSDWISANLAVFEQYPDAAIVFGDVVPPPDGQGGDGYAPQSVADADFVVRSVRDWRSPDGVNVGIGASMAMRKSVVDALEGFDEFLGPGGELKSGDDTDISLRAVLAGHTIVRSTAVQVVHFGRRSHDDFRELTRFSMFSVGTVIGKLFRVAPGPMLWFAGGRVRQLIVRPMFIELSRLRRPPVLGRAIHLARGVWRGLRLPIDRSTSKFAVSATSR